MKNFHEGRIENVRKILKDKKLDAALFFSGESLNDLSSENTYYLSGFFEIWPHAVIVTKNDAVFFTPEPDRAEEGCKIEIADSRKEKIHKYLLKKRIRRVGVDTGFSFEKWNTLKGKLKNPAFKDISRNMLEMRGIKDKEEISKIKTAADVTKKVLKNIEDDINCGDESRLMQKIRTEFTKYGAETAFPPVVSGDENSSNIHYFDCNKKYRKIVMVDIGARKKFYNSDFTRTYVVQNDKEVLRAHETLEQLSAELLDFITCGTSVLEASNLAKTFLERAGYKRESVINFHSLGHGVGLNVHEWPAITSKGPLRKTVLGENMVFTLEPALYFKNRFGVRIENMYLLTTNGLKKL